MTDTSPFFDVSFPSLVECVFDKVISLSWYDGTTSGVALSSLHSMAFRFDLIDWGPGQELRVFAISALPVSAFELVVELFNRSEATKWPIWHPRWPNVAQEQEMMSAELNPILAQARSPEFVFATESSFKSIIAAKSLTEAARLMLPAEFDGFPKGGFGYWQMYLELPA